MSSLKDELGLGVDIAQASIKKAEKAAAKLYKNYNSPHAFKSMRKRFKKSWR